MPRPLSRLVVLMVVLLAVAAVPALSEAPNGSPSDVKAKVGAAAKTAAAEPDWLTLSETPAEKAAQEKEAPLYVTALGFLLKLGLVLGLAYLTILGLKRFSGIKGAVGGAGGRRIRVIENSSLGANKSLHLVEIGGRKLLVASTPNQISLITEVDLEDLPEPAAADQAPAGFKEQLTMFLGGKADASGASRNVAEMLRESTSFLQGKVGQIGQIRGKLKDA